MRRINISGKISIRGLSSKVSHITTPIFYPNAKPHIGHLYSSLLCDVSHRWQSLIGDKLLLTTGTDEHGIKIQTASEKLGFSEPRSFVDSLYPEFVKLDESCDIEITRFIRTTDCDHIKSVKQLWKLCWDNGYIYKGKHEGWYSVSDETFYPESKVIKQPTDPDKYINTESNNEVVFQSEVNYFFKLTAFREKLIKYIEENSSYIHPESKRSQILNELKSGLNIQDLSISRPVSRLKWGIDVPNDPDQKMYVWFDALCSYISSIGGIEAVSQDYPIQSLHHDTNGIITIESPQSLWKNTTHLIGKDIIRFHTIYWPCFLMAAGLPINKQVVVHSHWLCNGVKMSKSLGNVVDPIQMTNYYGSDAMRWFLLENSQLEEDGDFQEKRLFETRNMFVSKWGNLINRCCGGKFNINRATELFSNSPSPSNSVIELFKDDNNIQLQISSIIEKLDKLPKLMNLKIQHFDTAQLLRHIWSIINDANALVQAATPWKRNTKQQDAIIFTCIETSRILSILCQPIVPKLCQKLLNRKDVSLEKRSIEFAKFGADSTYGEHSNDKGREVPIQKIDGELYKMIVNRLVNK